jgi:hypothetical protein
VPRGGDAFAQDFGVARGAHELGQPTRELVVHLGRGGLAQVHHHHREIDAGGRGLHVLDLHDVLLPQDAGLVLQDQHAAAVAVLDDSSVQHELLARLQRQFQRHVRLSPARASGR